MEKLKNFFYCAALLSLSSCSTCCHDYKPDPTPLQVREVQTRTFEESDTKTVMKAMINVLQDEGYIVKNAVLDLGLLTAEKSIEVDGVESGTKIFNMFRGGDSNSSTHAVMEVSANVSDYGEETTKVRLNFQQKTYDTKGCVMDVSQVMDDAKYQIFFAKVSKGIFFQSENL